MQGCRMSADCRTAFLFVEWLARLQSNIAREEQHRTSDPCDESLVGLLNLGDHRTLVTGYIGVAAPPPSQRTILS